MATTSKLGLYLPEGTDVADVQTMLNNQLQTIDESLPVEFCTWADLPANPYLGMLIWIEPENELRFWDGSGWIYILSQRDSWGRIDFQTRFTEGAYVGPNWELGPYLKTTYTQIKGRRYRVGYSVQTDTDDHEDFGSNQVRIRYKYGTDSAVSDPLLYFMFADHMHYGQTFAVQHTSSFTYTADRDAIITLGMYLWRGNEGSAQIYFSGLTPNSFFVEDVGWI